jgi:hypothetical protein
MDRTIVCQPHDQLKDNPPLLKNVDTEQREWISATHSPPERWEDRGSISVTLLDLFFMPKIASIWGLKRCIKEPA